MLEWLWTWLRQLIVGIAAVAVDAHWITVVLVGAYCRVDVVVKKQSAGRLSICFPHMNEEKVRNFTCLFQN